VGTKNFAAWYNKIESESQIKKEQKFFILMTGSTDIIFDPFSRKQKRRVRYFDENKESFPICLISIFE
jgi:glucose-6-phosphate isomerase